MKKHLLMLTISILLSITAQTFAMDNPDAVKEELESPRSEISIIHLPPELLLNIYFFAVLNSAIVNDENLKDCLDIIRNHPSKVMIDFCRSFKPFCTFIKDRDAEEIKDYKEHLKQLCINFYKPLLKERFLNCINANKTEQLERCLDRIVIFLEFGDNPDDPILIPVLHYTTLYPWIVSTYNLVDLLILYGANINDIDPNTGETPFSWACLTYGLNKEQALTICKGNSIAADTLLIKLQNDRLPQELFLKHGAKFNVKAILLAIDRHKRLLKLLVSHHDNFYAENEDEHNLFLISSCNADNPEKIRQIIRDRAAGDTTQNITIQENNKNNSFCLLS